MSNTMHRTEINLETGEQTVIDLTDEEIAQNEIWQAQWDAEQAQIETNKQAQDAAKQSALDKLMALGLTEEEALALGVK